LHGTVEYLIVMQEDAKAHLATEGNDRMEDLNNRTAQEVLDDHLNLAEDDHLHYDDPYKRST